MDDVNQKVYRLLAEQIEELGFDPKTSEGLVPVYNVLKSAFQTDQIYGIFRAYRGELIDFVQKLLKGMKPEETKMLVTFGCPGGGYISLIDANYTQGLTLGTNWLKLDTFEPVPIEKIKNRLFWILTICDLKAIIVESFEKKQPEEGANKWDGSKSNGNMGKHSY